MVVPSSVSVKPIKQAIKENKDIKVKKKIKKFSEVMKIEAQAKKWFSCTKNRVVIVEIIKQKNSKFR